MLNNMVAPATDNGVYVVGSEKPKTETRIPHTQGSKPPHNNVTNENKPWYNYFTTLGKNTAPCFARASERLAHYAVLIILGVFIWGVLWISFGSGWSWNGPWLRMSLVAIVAWASGEALQCMTSLPPPLAALLTGILARNFGYLDMRDFVQIEQFLLKIFSVIILGKASLGWDTNYMKKNWRQVAALGAMPWIADVTTLAICTHFLLGHPWIWGFLLGTFYASVTCHPLLPNIMKVGMSPRRTRHWPQFFSTAAGVDTLLSVGMYGVLMSFYFSNPNDPEEYRYFRAFSTLFLGVALGVIWGCLAGVIPHSSDQYVAELRILFVLISAVSCNFALGYVGWVGIAGVATLTCHATAANFWAKKGWKLGNNPATTAYRVMWSVSEPVLFAFAGTFFVINESVFTTLLYGFIILLICTTVRLTVTALMCWQLSLREKIFVCCVWSSKTIVTAVLCTNALYILRTRGGATAEEIRYAEDFITLSVQQILVSTTLAFLLTKYLGPILIKDKPLDYENCKFIRARTQSMK